MTSKRIKRARRLPNPRPGNEEPIALTAAIVDQLRDTISIAVSKLIGEYAAVTGLANLGEKFNIEVTHTVLISVVLHWDIPKRVRRSVVRKQMEAVAEQAADLAKQLRSLQATLDELMPLYRSEIVKGLELPLKAEWTGLKLERTPDFLAWKFDNASNKAGILAPMFVDTAASLPWSSFESWCGNSFTLLSAPRGAPRR